MDFENKIVVVFCYEEYKDRVIKLKVEYKFFFVRENFFEVFFERFFDLMREEFEFEFVRVLVRKFNMGGMYVEEIFLRVGFEKMVLVKELSDEDLKRVYDEMIRIFNDEFKLNIVFKDGVMYDVVLIELKIYEGFEKCYFFIFSEVLDEYFGKIMFEKVKIE